jgi:adenosylhomocysteine nucleosidase
MNNLPVIVIIVSADAEWRAVRPRLDGATWLTTPYGEAAVRPAPDGRHQLIFFHGGWGKIAAAASAQYAIDRWAPKLLINLGTCGGFAGDIAPGTVLLVDFTLVYDVLEQMGDGEAALAHYATELDLSWLPARLPGPVLRTMLLSAARDIVAGEIQGLRERYGAVAADWESGAIAFVARRNGVRCLILRAVSDVVSPDGGETYGDVALFQARTNEVMGHLLDALPDWLAVLPE